MRPLPREVGHEQRRVQDIPNRVLQRLVVRKGSVPALMSNHPGTAEERARVRVRVSETDCVRMRVYTRAHTRALRGARARYWTRRDPGDNKCTLRWRQQMQLPAVETTALEGDESPHLAVRPPSIPLRKQSSPPTFRERVVPIVHPSLARHRYRLTMTRSHQRVCAWRRFARASVNPSVGPFVPVSYTHLTLPTKA